MKEIFVLVPLFVPTGPIKGAVALANALASTRKVTLVALKSGPGVDAALHERVRQVCLGDLPTHLHRLMAYRRMLRDAGGRSRVASISLCFSADLVNVFCRGVAVTCASVRGHLTQVYRLDYGALATPLAVGHLVALRGMDHVVAMTTAMGAQVAGYTGRMPVRIGNFVDEAGLEKYRSARFDGPLRFAFLGSLRPLKRPEMVIDAFSEIVAGGVAAHLDVIGDGPLKAAVAERIAKKNLQAAVTLHGHLEDPYPVLARADAMVLPSRTEGMARASLEALHLGVPCVLSDADGNGEIIQDGVNGVLLKRDADLPAAMLAAARISRAMTARRSLLPEGCRQEIASQRYLDLVEAV